jgi:hypothetical protein
MTKHYRAFFSMPITADNDDDALALASEYANSLLHPNSEVIGGHLECLTQVTSGSFVPERLVFEDARLWDQLP